VTGDLDLTQASSRVRIRNGLTVTGGRVRLNNNGGIGFEGNQTFAGEMLFEGDTGFLSIDGNTTLTLAPTALIHGKSGRIGQAIFQGGTAVLVNQGTLRANVAGGTLFLNPNTFTHTGTLETLNGGILAIGPSSWTQNGTVRVGTGTVQLGGTLTLGAGAVWLSNGGTLQLTGLLDLDGATLALNPTTGSLVMNTGLLRNGTVTQTGGAQMLFSASSQNFLDAIQVVGDLDLTPNSSRVRIRNGLTVTGGRVRLNNNGGIGFEGNQTFAGEMLFEGDTGFLSIDGNTTLTLAPTALIHGKSGRIGQAIFQGGTAVLVNQGTIRANVAGGTLFLNPNTFTHTGTLETLNGGILAIGPSSWTQNGTVRVGTGTVQLGGTVTLGPGGVWLSNGGSLQLTGLLDLGGATLALNPTTGSLVMNSGLLRNGTVTQTGGAQLLFNASSQNFLDAIQVVGDLDLTPNSSRVRIRNGLTLTGGRVRLNNNGAIGFEGNQTFAGEMVFEGDTGFLSIDGNTTLTLAPTALIHGKSGRIGQAVFQGGTAVLVNQGTLRANVAAGTLFVNPTTLTNTGTLESLNGGVLAIGPTAWTQNGTVRIGVGAVQMGGTVTLGASGSFLSTGGILELTGLLDLGGATLSLNATTGSLLLNSGTLRNGTVAQTGGSPLKFNSSSQNFLESMTVSGDLDLTTASARVRVRNGLTVNGGRVRLNNNSVIGFDGVQTFAGEVVFEGDTSFLSLDGNATLTLAPTALIHGKSGRVGQALFQGGTAVLVNQGTLRADVAAGTILVNPNTFTNTGTLESSNGGVLAIGPTAWTQNGTVRTGVGTVQLGGTITLGASGSFVSNGGALELTGLLDLGGATLSVNATTGSLLLNSGTLRNGTVAQTGGAQLRFNSSGQNFLDSIAMNGDLDLTAASSRARIRNGLTISNGRVRLNNNGVIGFEGNQAFAGEMVFEGDTGFLSIDGNTTLTLAPTALVHGKTGRIGQAIFQGGTSVLVNQGTIRAEVAGGTLTVNPTTFTNTGTLNQTNGGRLVAPGFP
jgi:hypothetical protein